MAARSFMGSGDVLIEAIVNGVGQGLEGPFYANKLAAQPQVTTFESISKGRYDRGQVLESVAIAQPTELTLELKEIAGSVLAYAMLGTTSNRTVVSGSMSAQVVIANKGKWAETGFLRLAASQAVNVLTARTGTYAATAGNTGNFTAGSVTIAANTLVGTYTGTMTSATAYTVVGPNGATVGTGTFGSAFSAGGIGVTLTAGATPAVAGDKFTIAVVGSGSPTLLVEGTDYILNRPLGLVKLLDGSSTADNAVLTLTGAYAGAGGTRIRGATKSEVRVRILFDGINNADGSEVTAEFYEAVLAVESEFDFMPDEFGVVSLTGKLKTPANKTEPFIVDVKPV